MARHTRRLTIDALRHEDADALFRYRADPRVSRYQGWAPASVGEALHFIQTQDGVAAGAPGTWYQRALRLRGSDELVGDLGLHFSAEPAGTVELGISLASAQQGTGLATEALRDALDYVFGELQQHRATASVDPRNHACMKLMSNIGLRQEAHFRESLCLGGVWVDDVVFAILGREWRARHESRIDHD